MNAKRPTKTLADYLVIAVSPALIMVMVHSVCFFLVEVFYRGEAGGGVRWVLFWLVLAVVLIARIGIEQGDGHAMVFGLALACVTWLYLATIQPNVVFGALLLGIVWFMAHKLTCSCTLIDEDADASGQGLLQTLWRLPQKFRKAHPPAAKTAAKTQVSPASVPSTKKPKAASSQIPGVWLIYFSLAALAIFGLGQTLLPAGDTAARRQGFVYLFLYLAAALGLLVTTSFLGLRRYLRQRYLVMPDNIAFGWVKFGAIGAAIVLCLSLLLPRPGAGEAWGTLRYQVNYQLHRASEYAARFNPHGKGSGQAGNQARSAGQQQNHAAQSGQAPGSNQEQNMGANRHGATPAQPASQHSTPQQSGGNQARPLPHLSPPAGAVYPWLRALFWVVVALGLAWGCYRYRAVILTALRSAWAALRNFIAALLGWFRPSASASPVASKTAAPPPFKSFKNPFLTGADRLWPPEQLITYSYDALRSWALESAAQEDSPQTPREFCRQLGEEMPEAADALEYLGFLYGHVAYGGSVPANYAPEHLRPLWDWMSNPRPAGQVREPMASQR